MIFNSTEFLFVFLPIVLALFYLAPVRSRLLVLLTSSLAFYALSGLVPAIFMVLSIIWSYSLARMIHRVPRKILFACSLLFPLWVLFMFRYLDFTFTSLDVGEETRDEFSFFLSVLVPAGISFYTFQIISYSVDVVNDQQPAEKDFIKFATYISFFPQLIAGPILRFDQISSQLDKISSERNIGADWRTAIKFISVGLFAKVILADMLGIVNRQVTTFDSLTSADALISILAYSFQIYYDFFSYSLIAIGLAKLFGINLPKNFDEPYKAASPRDFWRRWHLTLSYWLRDYVYLRLSGKDRYVRNITIVFIACGLWHGAGWNFVLWGAYHGFWVVFYHFTRRWWDRLPHALQVVVTFTIVTLGWPLFYLDVQSYAGLLLVLLEGSYGAMAYGYKQIALLAVIGLWTFAAKEKNWLYNSGGGSFTDNPVLQAAALYGAVIFFTYSKTFIYFRF